jgi:hypothetical protein
MAITKNNTCGIKFESVVVDDTGLSTYFGMKTKIMISKIGTTIPKILYNYGLEELLQTRHHTILKTIANMIINVPIPISNIFPEP